MGEAIVLQDRIGEATSLIDWTGGVAKTPRVDLMGEEVGRDQMAVSCEAGDGWDGEVERDPIPDLAWPGTEAGADDHAW